MAIISTIVNNPASVSSNDAFTHFVYEIKIVNNMNGQIKFYYGAHSTIDINDNYIGSGSAIATIKRQQRASIIADKNNPLYTFSRRILQTFATVDDALDAEPEFIKQGMRDHGKLCLNKTTARQKTTFKPGCDNGHKPGEFEHTLETRILMSNYHKALGTNLGSTRSDEQRANMSNGREGIKFNCTRWSEKEFNDLKAMWNRYNKPSYGAFRSIAVMAGYRDVSYQQLLNNFKNDTLPKYMAK